MYTLSFGIIIFQKLELESWDNWGDTGSGYNPGNQANNRNPGNNQGQGE